MRRAIVESGLRTDVTDVDRLERDNVAVRPGKETARAREFALCGVVLPHHAIEVRDERGRVLPDRRVGRIFARGPSLMKYYFGAPEETAKILSDGWLDTGDLGYMLGKSWDARSRRRSFTTDAYGEAPSIGGVADDRLRRDASADLGGY